MCDKLQTLYFYIDATASNTFENFCPLIVTLQMLVAAFNPSANSTTHIGALLFSDTVRRTGPSPVFSIGTPCFDAVQGQDYSLLSLILNFEECLDRNRNYDSMTFPSLCGEITSAVPGLREIYNTASTTRNSIATVLMLTDGIIQDNATERTRVLSDLRYRTEFNTLIAAGIGHADIENLKLYTSADNVLIQNDSVDLGIDVVNQMAVKGILCQEHGILALSLYIGRPFLSFFNI